ncbi:MAG: hypothetical protein HY517_02785 [Candidatus Aenigmarchaeota archaeon]|nr:hypothetical protein [Candidatus Aenigmarchaeota archaeon]
MNVAYVGVTEDRSMDIGPETSLQVRLDACYHCTNNDADHRAIREPVVTEQWVKYFGDGLRAYECQRCKKLLYDSDFSLNQREFDDIKVGGTD